MKLRHIFPQADKIERTAEHSKQLISQFLDKNNGRYLSPSAINTWLSCRMKFYYRYVNRLMEPENISADIDPASLGNILHEIMKNLYTPYIGSALTNDILNRIIRNKQLLSAIINEAVNEMYKAGRNDSESGNELIVRDVLMTYLLRILNTDKAFQPLIIHNLEATI